VLFSLAPLAIVLVSVFGLVLQDDDLRESVTDAIIDYLPIDAAASEDVEQAIEAIASPASAAGLISLVLFLWAASGMMGALRRGLEAAMGVVESRPVARNKLVDLALVGATTVLVAVSFGLGLLAQLIEEIVASTGVGGGAVETALGLGFQFLLSLATVLLLYRFVPARRLRVSDALAGALVTAVLLVGISVASDLVFAKATEWSLIYGSLAALLVFLYSVYLSASALLLGAAVAAEWSQPHEPDEAGSFKDRIRREIRGLFVR
jgi:membrane protein